MVESERPKSPPFSSPLSGESPLPDLFSAPVPIAAPVEEWSDFDELPISGREPCVLQGVLRSDLPVEGVPSAPGRVEVLGPFLRTEEGRRLLAESIREAQARGRPW